MGQSLMTVVIAIEFPAEPKALIEADRGSIRGHDLKAGGRSADTLCPAQNGYEAIAGQTAPAIILVRRDQVEANDAVMHCALGERPNDALVVAHGCEHGRQGKVLKDLAHFADLARR